MSHDLDLSDAADRFDIPTGDVDAVVSRARRRTRRHRAGVATITAIAVVTAAASFIGTRGDGSPGPGRVLASGNASAKVGDVGLTWARADSATALSYVQGVAGEGPLYALSTSPGETDFNKARQKGTVWRSSDGVDWQSVTRLGSDLFLADLAPAGDRVYAVGTGPATAAVAGGRKTPSLVAGWSDDGGKTWTKADLPVDMAAVASKTKSSGVGDTQIAANDKGTLAVAVLRAYLDVDALLPAGATAPNGWATTPNGIDLLGPRKDNVCPAGTTSEKGSESPAAKSGATAERPTEVSPTYCFTGDPNGPRVGPDDITVISAQEAHGVTASYTWEQLGVGGDQLKAVRSEPIAFFAPAGSTQFERVDLPAETAGSPTMVEADGDGFDVVVALRSDPLNADGTGSVALLHSVDGRHWGPKQLQQGVRWLTAAGKLGGRTTLIGDGDAGPVLLTKADDGGWAVTQLGDLVEHAADAKLALGTAGVGPAGVGAVLMEIPDESRDKAARENWQPVNHLIVSRDGHTWQEQSLDDIAGTKTAGVGSIYVSTNRIVVSALLPKANDKDPTAPRVTLVATPR